MARPIELRGGQPFSEGSNTNWRRKIISSLEEGPPEMVDGILVAAQGAIAVIALASAARLAQQLIQKGPELAQRLSEIGSNVLPALSNFIEQVGKLPAS